MNLPEGVQLNDFIMHEDDRGVFTEIFREEWIDEMKIIQWNSVVSKKNVLRGVHAHKAHWDYLTVIKGRVLFGLHDLRSDSPTYQRSAMIELNENKLQALIIPPGVAHGFYFLEDSIHVYAVSEYWNTKDELGCHYADPHLHLNWPNNDPVISKRDMDLPSYEELVSEFTAKTVVSHD